MLKESAIFYKMDLIDKLTKLREKMETDFEGFPEGYCMKASEIVAEELKMKKARGIFVDDHGISHVHAWNKKDGKIYDLTADQFSGKFPKIYIIEENSDDAKSTYREGIIVDRRLY